MRFKEALWGALGRKWLSASELHDKICPKVTGKSIRNARSIACILTSWRRYGFVEYKNHRYRKSPDLLSASFDHIRFLMDKKNLQPIGNDLPWWVSEIELELERELERERVAGNAKENLPSTDRAYHPIVEKRSSNPAQAIAVIVSAVSSLFLSAFIKSIILTSVNFSTVIALLRSQFLPFLFLGLFFFLCKRKGEVLTFDESGELIEKTVKKLLKGVRYLISIWTRKRKELPNFLSLSPFQWKRQPKHPSSEKKGGLFRLEH